MNDTEISLSLQCYEEIVGRYIGWLKEGNCQKLIMALRGKKIALILTEPEITCRLMEKFRDIKVGESIAVLRLPKDLHVRLLRE